MVLLALAHINLPDCDITDDSLLNVKVCVMCVRVILMGLSSTCPYKLTRL